MGILQSMEKHEKPTVGIALLCGWVTGLLSLWRRLLVVVWTLPRDLRYFYAKHRAGRIMRRLERGNATLVSVLEEHARRTPARTCFLFEDQTWTYKDVDDYSNQAARALQRVGVSRGDVVALVLDNRVEYVCLWLGAAKLGAVTALVNRNLRRDPLAHTLNAAAAGAVLFGRDYADAVDEVRGALHGGQRQMLFLQFDDDRQAAEAAWFRNLVPLIDAEIADRPAGVAALGFHDPVLYFYTSGTTGMPKAAVISHARMLLWPLGNKLSSGLVAGRDVLYCPLPLYHVSGGAYTCCMALAHGVAVAYAAKFSASRFWSDCVKHGATAAQYIGEISRFLVLTPESAGDRGHGVRLLVGNGMSPGVWRAVQHRFGVPRVTEFYGSTEGNVMLENATGKVGAVGFVPRLLPRCLWPVDLVRLDEETGQPFRDAAGRCVRCEQGEPGMIIARIREDAVHAQFTGYLDRQATEKKIARDVFAAGDRYFLSGDVLVMDELGFIYFRDRIGDTYRWKGENVSTAEVEVIMTRILLPQGVGEVAAYGVQVPGHEGRAGMAAFADPEGHADLRLLAEQLSQTLPSYARPVFVRVARALPMTGTHKVSKVLLQREGYEAVSDDDKVFVFDARGGGYVPLTEALLADLRDNKLRI